MTATATAPPAVSTEHRGADVWRWLIVAGCVLVLTGVTLWFRYRAVGISSLWLDDAWVGVGSKFPTIGDTIASGLTSPGFSLTYRGWATVFGDSATTAQLFTLAFAVAAPVVLFLAAMERGLPWYAALLGAGLLATAPAHIDMSSRLKQYAPEALTTTVVLWTAWRVLDRPADPRRWALFAAAMIGASFLSSIGALVAGSALAVCFVAALLARPRRLRPALVATCAYGLVVAPWMLFAVRPNVSDKLTDYWRGYFLDGSGFAGGLGTRLQVVAHGFQDVNSTVVLVGLAVAAGVVLVRRPLVGLLLLFPTFVAVVLAAVTLVPIGTGRTDIYLFPSYALLAALAVAEVAALLPARRRWAIGALAVAGFAAVASIATPSPTTGTVCPDPPVEGSVLLRCGHPREDLTPLVRLVERIRGPDDEIVVYPNAGYAYGFATRYPIERQPDALAPTDWVVKVRGPRVLVLRAHREDPEKWARPLDQLAARSPRVWLIGSHHLHLDWKALADLLWERGYRPVQIRERGGASLLLFDRRVADGSESAPVVPAR